jgi:predicted nucleotidyltransferase
MEASLVRGEEFNIPDYTALCAGLVKVAKVIGVDRRAREVVPTLRGYLEQTYGTQEVT